MTRVAHATLLNNIAPLWVALYTVVFWRERLSGRFWLGLALTLGGAAVVFGNDLVSNPHLSLGDLLALVSSLFYAAYFLVAQRGRAQMDAHLHLAGGFERSSRFIGIQPGAGAVTGGYSSATYLEPGRGDHLGWWLLPGGLRWATCRPRWSRRP
jgi:drug/metabolite transporter (DMT)-like permease